LDKTWPFAFLLSRTASLLLCRILSRSPVFIGRAPRNQKSIEVGKLPSKRRDKKDTHKVGAEVLVSRATRSNTDGDLNQVSTCYLSRLESSYSVRPSDDSPCWNGDIVNLSKTSIRATCHATGIKISRGGRYGAGIVVDLCKVLDAW
jgi:hypothetical protein